MFVMRPGRQRLTVLGHLLATAQENKASATFIGLRSCLPRSFLSTSSHIREYQTLGNLVLILRVPRHLGISRAAITRLPYLIGIIGRSSRRSSCRTTHTVQNMSLFCSSGSRKLATLGKCHIVGMSFVLLVSLEYIWNRFCFFFFYSFCMLKNLCELL